MGYRRGPKGGPIGGQSRFCTDPQLRAVRELIFNTACLGPFWKNIASVSGVFEGLLHSVHT